MLPKWALAGAAVCMTVTTVLPAAPAHADRARNSQWHLKSLRINEAHKITRGAGITVAVVDTGVDPHPDLRRNLLPGTTVVEGDKGNGQIDHDGHGTMMAGIIAAHGRSRRDGALGIAPEAKILPIKQSKPGDNGGSMDVAAGIEWAVAQRADIINVSLATGPTSVLDSAIKRAAENDVVVVAGSGNRRTQLLFAYPAAMSGVLAVGAADRSGQVADLTVTGKPMDICAPGVDIYSTGNKKDYYKSSGTSDATAVVSGAAALVRAKFPDLSAPEVIHRLTATARDNGKPGRDDQCGHGVLDVVKALTAEVPPLARPTASSSPATSTATPTAGPTAGPTASGAGSGSAAPDMKPAGDNAAAAIGGGVVVALLGGLIALLVARRRRRPPTR
jgi:type VII secretion-associated serine protease mycosin